MTKYHVSVSQPTLDMYDNVSTFIIESDKTAVELKQEILEHNKKRGVLVNRVNVSEFRIKEKAGE